MIDPATVVQVVTATKTALDIFDKISGQIKSVLLKRPKEAEGDEERWRYKITGEGDKIVVRQQTNTIQTLTRDELAQKLKPSDLSLVETYEEHMERGFRIWQKVYRQKDASPDPRVNAQVDEQLVDIITGMKKDLTGIIEFLRRLQVMLDDHYEHVRQLVEELDGGKI